MSVFRIRNINQKPVIIILSDGQIIWNGRVVDTDDDLRDAMKELAQILKGTNMKNNFKPIKEAKKDGTEYLLLCRGYFGDYSKELGSFRVDEGFSGDKEPNWFNNSHDDWSCGYASAMLDPIGFMEVDCTEFVREYEKNLNKETEKC